MATVEHVLALIIFSKLLDSWLKVGGGDCAFDLDLHIRLFHLVRPLSSQRLNLFGLTLSPALLNLWIDLCSFVLDHLVLRLIFLRLDHHGYLCSCPLLEERILTYKITGT